MTTLEELYSQHAATTSLIPYKNWVIVAFPTYRGVEVQIFQSLADGANLYESNLVEAYDDEQVFTDQGHAVKWAFDIIENLEEH